MTNKCCVLFTYEYPFLTSEPFLESEIDFLSKEFRKIYIFSLNGCSQDKQSRNLPPNVFPVPLNCKQYKLKNILKGIFVKNKVIKPSFKNGFYCTLADYYTIGRFSGAFKKILNYFDTMNEHFSYDEIVIYSYWMNISYLSLLLKRYLKKTTNVKVVSVSRAHGYDLYSERNKINYIPFQREFCNLLDLISTISNHGKMYLENKFPNHESKIVVSRLGTKDFGLNNLNSDISYDICTCSRFRDIKRIPLIAQSFSVLSKKENVSWLCIGDGEEKERIIEILNHNNVINHVCLKGRLSNTDTLLLYKKTNIRYFVNVSVYEGIPVSIMEAMSFGIPCIATDVGGTNEIVDNECGRIISANQTPNSLSEIIEEELSISDDEYLKKRLMARKKWETLYSADNNYCNWIKILNRL